MRFLTVLKTREGRPLNFERLEPLIDEVCQKYGLSLFYLFGSYASAQASKLSDLDVAVLPEQGLALDRLLDLTGELQEIFPLIHRVLKEGKCLYARDLRTKIENETRWESLYLDTEPLRREHFESLEKRLKDGTFGHR